MVLCQILQEIEKKVRQPIKDCFDWIAGTSTGGILALAVCQGIIDVISIYRLRLTLYIGKRGVNSLSVVTAFDVSTQQMFLHK